MGASNHVVLSNNLGEFFKAEVGTARSSLGVHLSDMTEFYVVNLLCTFSRVDKSPQFGEEPLAFLYKRALEAHVGERVQRLKELGDTSLYLSGFFADFVDDSLVDVDYYVTMGGHAYNDLSRMMGKHPQGETFASLYKQLAFRFTDLVDVLNEVAESTREHVSNNTDLLKLYDRFARTKSKRLSRALHERGLVPCEDVPTEYVQ